MHVLVTGAAGFVGAQTTAELIERGHTVTGLDHFDDSYSVQLKRERVTELVDHEPFCFVEGDIRSADDVAKAFEHRPDAVIHLAAQGGLRKSMTNPAPFISSNVGGFGAVIKAAVDHDVHTFVYASSGAVYGGTSVRPFTETDAASWPLSLYGATKRSDELLAYSYAHSTGLRCTGLRLSTVYGPCGRPDMASYEFARRIAVGEPIDVHGQGKMLRDFVFSTDIAHCFVLAAEDDTEFAPTVIGNGPSEQTMDTPWRVLNAATGREIDLHTMIRIIEDAVGSPAKLNYVDALPSEVIENRMDVTAIVNALGYRPSTAVEDGMPRAVAWYLDYLSHR